MANEGDGDDASDQIGDPTCRTNEATKQPQGPNVLAVVVGVGGAVADARVAHAIRPRLAWDLAPPLGALVAHDVAAPERTNDDFFLIFKKCK